LFICNDCLREFKNPGGLGAHLKCKDEFGNCKHQVKIRDQRVECPNPNNNLKCQKLCKPWTKHGLCRSCSAQQNYKDIRTGKTIDEIHGVEKADELRKGLSIRFSKWRKEHPEHSPTKGRKLTDEQKRHLSNKTSEHWNSLSEEEKVIRRKRAADILTSPEVQLASALGRIRYLNSDKSTKSNTVPERIFESYLKELNLSYEKQKLYGYYSFDFYLIDFDIYIEIDGDYWHCNEKSFPIPSKMQKENLHRDKSKNTFMKNKHKYFIRFWESDIKNDKDVVIQQLEEMIEFVCSIESLKV
jgi:very-short-patch-repair endonuclease